MLNEKIKNVAALKRIAATLRAKGKRIVFTNGCFDILHYGHVKYLEDAKKKGDILIVGVNSDASVKRIKGKGRPVVRQEDRIRTLAGLESVNYAVIFGKETPLELIMALKPHILVKGSDWKKNNIVGAEFVLGLGGKVSTVKLSHGRSTTALINKIAQKY